MKTHDHIVMFQRLQEVYTKVKKKKLDSVQTTVQVEYC